MYGQTGDDFVSLEPSGASKAAHGSGGDIINVVINDIRPQKFTGRSAVFIFHGDGNALKSWRISNVITEDGPGGNSLVRIGAEGSSLITSAPTVNDIQRLSIENIVAQGQSSAAIEFDGPGKQINIHNVISFKDNRLIHFKSDQDSVDDIHAPDLYHLNAQGASIGQNSGTSLNRPVFSNVWFHDANNNKYMFDFAGTFTDLTIDGAVCLSAANLFDFRGTVDGQVSDVRDYGASTVYAYMASVDFGHDVPPIASWTYTISGGSATGVKTNEYTNVITEQTRELRAKQWVSAGPGATYSVGRWEWDDEWDNTNTRRDVTLRSNLVTDPGGNNDITVSYEIYPDAA